MSTVSTSASFVLYFFLNFHKHQNQSSNVMISGADLTSDRRRGDKVDVVGGGPTDGEEGEGGAAQN